MELNTSELKEKAKTLKPGDKIELSGTVYTSRDAAHKRIKQLIEEGKALPFDIDGAAIYYAGPTGTKEGMAIGSCGPTTSGRMDPYAPMLLDMGLSESDISMKGIGYKEIIGYYNGEYDLETALNLVKKNTRRYAKRQLTWFKSDESVEWFAPDDISGILSCVDNFIEKN